jgi:hypothetical protein
MSEKLFDVVFFGILQAGKDKETVLQNMATVFKTDAVKLAPYFAGGRKVIKGKVNAVTAEKYLSALENIGLVIKVEPYETEQDATQPDDPASNKETDQQSTQAGNTGTDAGDITVAPVGSNAIEHPVEVPAQKIADISNVSMAEAGADVIENPVTIPAQKIEDISSITLAEVGSDVLENPTAVIVQNIDELTDVSLAEAGADLIENPRPKVKADIPDTSELSLDNESEPAS